MLQILHIDDHPDDSRRIEDQLRQHGLAVSLQRVDRAADVLAALTGPSRWDAVFSEFDLPAIGFSNVPRWVRQHAPDCPLVVVTGSIGEAAVVELLSEGVWEFVPKDPLSRLMPALERCLRDRAQRLMAPEPNVLHDPAVIDLRVLARRLPPGSDQLHPLARLFAETARTTLGEMDDALRRGDAAALRALAHRLRSGAAAVGALRSAELCAEIETRCTAEAALAAPLIAALRQTHDAIAARLQALPADTTGHPA